MDTIGYFLEQKPHVHTELIMSSAEVKSLLVCCYLKLWMQTMLAYCSHAGLPHFYVDGGGGVDHGILSPSWALPLRHGQHGHSRSHQGKCTSLQDGKSASETQKEKWLFLRLARSYW